MVAFKLVLLIEENRLREEGEMIRLATSEGFSIEVVRSIHELVELLNSTEEFDALIVADYLTATNGNPTEDSEQSLGRILSPLRRKRFFEGAYIVDENYAPAEHTILRREWPSAIIPLPIDLNFFMQVVRSAHRCFERREKTYN